MSDMTNKSSGNSCFAGGVIWQANLDDRLCRHLATVALDSPPLHKSLQDVALL